VELKEKNLGAFFDSRRESKNRAFRGFRRASGAAASRPSNPLARLKSLPGCMGGQRSAATRNPSFLQFSIFYFLFLT
jgi:hypothetical protein